MSADGHKPERDAGYAHEAHLSPGRHPAGFRNARRAAGRASVPELFQHIFRRLTALFRAFAKQFESFRFVLPQAGPGHVAHAEVELPVRMSLFGGLAPPRGGFRLVLLHAESELETVPESVLRITDQRRLPDGILLPAAD